MDKLVKRSSVNQVNTGASEGVGKKHSRKNNKRKRRTHTIQGSYMHQ